MNVKADKYFQFSLKWASMKKSMTGLKTEQNDIERMRILNVRLVNVLSVELSASCFISDATYSYWTLYIFHLYIMSLSIIVSCH